MCPYCQGYLHHNPRWLKYRFTFYITKTIITHRHVKVTIYVINTDAMTNRFFNINLKAPEFIVTCQIIININNIIYVLKHLRHITGNLTTCLRIGAIHFCHDCLQHGWSRRHFDNLNACINIITANVVP